MKAASDFLNAPEKSPAFVRVESSLMPALAGAPKLTVPAATAQNSPSIFELRTYESATDQDHHGEGGASKRRRNPHFPQGRILARLFRRHSHRPADAEPHLHDWFCEPCRTRQGLGRLPAAPETKIAVRPTEIHVRGPGIPTVNNSVLTRRRRYSQMPTTTAGLARRPELHSGVPQPTRSRACFRSPEGLPTPRPT